MLILFLNLPQTGYICLVYYWSCPTLIGFLDAWIHAALTFLFFIYDLLGSRKAP